MLNFWKGHAVIITWTEEAFDRFSTSDFVCHTCPDQFDDSWRVLAFSNKKARRARMSSMRRLYGTDEPVLLVLNPDKLKTKCPLVISIQRHVAAATHCVFTGTELEEVLGQTGLAHLIKEDPVEFSTCCMTGCWNNHGGRFPCITCGGCFCEQVCFNSHECII